MYGYYKIRRIFNKFLDWKSDFVIHKNVVLPAHHLRFCGKDFMDDSFFLRSCEEEAKRLVDMIGLSREIRLLEIGCGPGRLPIGILNYFGNVKYYHGIDVDKKSIKWCKKHISKRNPFFHFSRIDAKNERYNPHGNEMSKAFSLPFENGNFDIIYLHSVFTNMIEKDIRIYMKEFKRVLKSTGRIFLTAFVEENVPDVTYNPENYIMPCSGALHIVRYEKDFLFSIFQDNGFDVERYDYGMELGKQSGIYLKVLGIENV